MHVCYRADGDGLTITVRENVTGPTEGDEVAPGVIIHTDTEGNLVSIEILDASTRVTRPTTVELEVHEFADEPPARRATG